MAWAVVFAPAAEKQVAALDRPVRVRILAALARLSDDPHAAAGVKALHGGGFRLRVGDWRVVYALRAEELVVAVVRVAHRREAYRP